MTAEITVVVPTWKSSGFVEETFASISEQTFGEFTVVVSVDPSPDDTLEVCRRYARQDSRFRITEQIERAGWVGNTNRGFDMVDTRLFMFMPHDDVLTPNYLSSLRSALDRHPDAVCAYPDVERFENVHATIHVDSLIGSPVERAASWLTGMFGSLPFRGLTRRSVLDAGLRLIEGPVDGMHADVLWVLELALAGDCIRVPETVFRKRVRDGSVVRSWEATPLDAKRAGMVFHLVEVIETVSRAGLSQMEQEKLVGLALRRLDQIPHRWRPFTNEDERVEFHAELVLAVQARAREGVGTASR